VPPDLNAGEVRTKISVEVGDREWKIRSKGSKRTEWRSLGVGSRGHTRDETDE
jgi:hypothetical protein